MDCSRVKHRLDPLPSEPHITKAMTELRETTKNRIIKQLESKPLKDTRKDILYTRLGYDLNSPSHHFCVAWLDLKEAERREDLEKAAYIRAEEANNIARDAALVASSQARLAKWSALIATTVAIIAHKTAIFSIVNKLIAYLQT